MSTNDSVRTELSLKEPMLLRPNEAAGMLSIGISKLYMLVKSGEIPSLQVGGNTRIPLNALRAWIDQHTSTAPRVKDE